MTDRPILFSAPMVRAILDGTKTQTRRVVKPQPYIDAQGNFCWNGGNFGQNFSGPHIQAIASPLPNSRTGRVYCPYGKPSDRLWVRETWMPDAPHDGTWASMQFYGCKHSPLSDIPERFRKAEHCIHRASWEGPPLVGWKPSIHMPRWASRITLEITGVRVERLQDISEADAKAEGVTRIPYPDRFLGPDGVSHENPVHRSLFRDLWKQINGAGSWEANPWVWVVEFKPVV